MLLIAVGLFFPVYLTLAADIAVKLPRAECAGAPELLRLREAVLCSPAPPRDAAAGRDAGAQAARASAVPVTI